MFRKVPVTGKKKPSVDSRIFYRTDNLPFDSYTVGAQCGPAYLS